MTADTYPDVYHSVIRVSRDLVDKLWSVTMAGLAAAAALEPPLQAELEQGLYCRAQGPILPKSYHCRGSVYHLRRGGRATAIAQRRPALCHERTP